MQLRKRQSSVCGVVFLSLSIWLIISDIQKGRLLPPQRRPFSVSKTAFRIVKGGLWQNRRLRAGLIFAFFLQEIYVQRRPENYQRGGRECEGVSVGPAERVAEK